MITIQNLVKYYGDVQAVDHLDLQIEEGEIFGLLGPNGAGKTTIILTLLGLSEPTSGTVHVNDFNATTEPIDVKRITGYLPDDVGFSDNRTGMENLIYTGRINGFSYQEAAKSADDLLDRVGLESAKHKKTKTYSRGMIQRLGLADVLIKDPEIIVLDEPTIGIDPKGINDFLEMIRRLSKDKGITVLLSSHLLEQVQKICDRVGILVEGKLLALGNINELADKLFGDRETTIELEVEPVTDGLLAALGDIERVAGVRQQDNLITMRGEKDRAPLISKVVAQQKANLYRLSYKNYALEDIYEHYFDGGDGHE